MGLPVTSAAGKEGGEVHRILDLPLGSSLGMAGSFCYQVAQTA